MGSRLVRNNKASVTKRWKGQALKPDPRERGLTAKTAVAGTVMGGRLGEVESATSGDKRIGDAAHHLFTKSVSEVGTLVPRTAPAPADVSYFPKKMRPVVVPAVDVRDEEEELLLLFVVLLAVCGSPMSWLGSATLCMERITTLHARSGKGYKG